MEADASVEVRNRYLGITPKQSTSTAQFVEWPQKCWHFLPAIVSFSLALGTFLCNPNKSARISLNPLAANILILLQLIAHS